jgi:hypothetical protein
MTLGEADSIGVGYQVSSSLRLDCCSSCIVYDEYS